MASRRKLGGINEQAMLAWGQAQDTPGGVPCSSSSSVMGSVESACERMVQTGLSTVKYASRRRAAVVGVILNLSLWFGLHVLFTEVALRELGMVKLWQPELASIDWRVAVLSVLCGIMLLKLHWGMARVLSLSAAMGWVLIEFT